MHKQWIMAVFAVTGLISGTLMAGEWSSATMVTEIYPHSTNNVDGTIYYDFKAKKNPAGCDNQRYIALKKTNNLFTEISTLLLSSYVSTRRIAYYVEGCDSHGFPELVHVKVGG